ncbi:MAG: prephenate dehydratase [Sandaracinaceae bacterium]|nr:prephenate dehydratase [Sandaracinaceae bacterium]
MTQRSAPDVGDLAPIRERIDAVDARLLELLAERADLVAAIADAKRASGLSTVDPERENLLLRKVLERGAGRFPREAIVAVFRAIMSASVSLQASVSVAYLGPAGTFSHLAARTLFGYAPRYLETVTIEGVFDAVRTGSASYGVVPFENSTEGSVAGVIEGLLVGGLFIRREVVLPIEHCLMGRATSLLEVERVYSHPQGLAQCREWLHRNVPRAQLVHTDSTAAAAREARRDTAGAAIGSTVAAELQGLDVLASRIQDHAGNETRFVMIGTERARPTGDDKTTIVFAIKDEESRGALRRILALIDEAGVNMTRIESRPRRGAAWRYLFVVDVEGHADDPPVAAAIARLEERCEGVTVLGSYPRYPR